MKKIVLVMILTFFIFPVTVSLSQEEMMNLNSEAFNIHRRPVVIFPHLQHEDMIDCTGCHHDYDKYGVNVDEEAKPCSQCHEVSATDNPVSLTNAFHRLCKGCHQAIIKKEKVDAPTMCGQCHKKNK